MPQTTPPPNLVISHHHLSLYLCRPVPHPTQARPLFSGSAQQDNPPAGALVGGPRNPSTAPDTTARSLSHMHTLRQKTHGIKMIARRAINKEGPAHIHHSSRATDASASARRYSLSRFTAMTGTDMRVSSYCVLNSGSCFVIVLMLINLKEFNKQA